MNPELTILIDSWRALCVSCCDAGEPDRALRDVVRSGTFLIAVAIESGGMERLHLPRESNAFARWRALQYQPPHFVYERGAHDLYGGRREGFCRCWLNIRCCCTESWKAGYLSLSGCWTWILHSVARLTGTTELKRGQTARLTSDVELSLPLVIIPFLTDFRFVNQGILKLQIIDGQVS